MLTIGVDPFIEPFVIAGIVALWVLFVCFCLFCLNWHHLGRECTCGKYHHSNPFRLNPFLQPLQEFLKQRDLKVSDKTIKGFLEEVDKIAPWFEPTGSLTLRCWDKLGRDIDREAQQRKLKAGTKPIWRLVRFCLEDKRCEDITKKGQRMLAAHQDSMSESGEEKRGERGECKGRKEPRLIEDSSSESEEERLDSEKEQDLEEAAAVYECERYGPDGLRSSASPPLYAPLHYKDKGNKSFYTAPSGTPYGCSLIKPGTWSKLAR